MIIKTTKEINYDLHSDAKAIIEFEYSYERSNRGLSVRVIPYAEQPTVGMGGEPILARQPIKGADTIRTLSEDQVISLLGSVMEITPGDENAMTYMDNLVANGIKLIIVSEGLWKNQLTMEDFE